MNAAVMLVVAPPTAVTELGGRISQSGSLHAGPTLALVPRPLSPRTLVGRSAAGAAGPPLSVRFVFPVPAAGAPEKPFAMIVSPPEVNVSVTAHTWPGPEAAPHAGLGFTLPKMMSAFDGPAPTASAVIASALKTESDMGLNMMGNSLR